MSTRSPSIAEFRSELYEIADRLETSALRWKFPKDELDFLDEVSDRVGAPRADAPWTGLPHADVVMGVIVPRLRELAADLESVPELPPEAPGDGEED